MTPTQKKNLLHVCDALESGDYKQGRDQLRRGGGYCCLGVACDVYRKVTKRGEWRDGIFGIDGACEVFVLPVKVRHWLGMEDECGPAVLGYVDSATANDEGCTFEQIAPAWREWAQRGGDG